MKPMLCCHSLAASAAIFFPLLFEIEREATFASTTVDNPKHAGVIQRLRAAVAAKEHGDCSASEVLSPTLGEEEPTPGMPVVLGEKIRQSIDFDSGSEFSLIIEEYSPLSLKWEESSFDYATANPVRTIAPRTAYQFFVAQTDGATSETVVERWNLQPQNGARTVTRIASQSQIGVSIPYRPPVESIVGGTYVPMASRQDAPTPTIVEVYRGAGIAEITTMNVDPEGRFLLVVSEPEKVLYQIPLIGGGAPTAIADVNSLPHLAVTTLFHPQQHQTQGRLYIFSSPHFYGVRTVVHDANNNGIFESATIYFPQDYESAGYTGTVWAEDFVVLP